MREGKNKGPAFKKEKNDEFNKKRKIFIWLWSAWKGRYLFFVARIWDAINDPMMGLVVDNTHNRFGKFRTWLLVGTLLNAVVFFAMFNTFGLHGKALYIYVSIAYILYGMTYTIMDVPYWSWLPNLTNQYQLFQDFSQG